MRIPSRACCVVLILALCLIGFALDHACQESNVWTSHGPYGGSISGAAVAAYNGSEVLYVPVGSLLNSTDGGMTWKSLRCSYVSAVACDATGQVVFTASQNHLSKSSDGGQTWTDTSFNAFQIRCVAVQRNNPAIVYVGASDADPPLSKTTDGGVHWESIGRDLPNRSAVHIALDPVDPNIVYVCIGGTPGGAFRSQDGGHSWTKLGANDDTARITINPKKHGTLFALGLSLQRSTDSGATWKKVGPSSFDYTIESLAINEKKPAVMYAGVLGGGIYRSKNGGKLWSLVGNSGTTFCNQLLVSPADGSRLYAADYEKILLSGDQGRTWAPTSLCATGLLCVASSPATGSPLYAGGRGLFRSLDGGGTWAMVGFWNQGVLAIVLPDSGSNTIYVATGSSGGLFKSEDGGRSWNALNTGLSWLYDVKALAVSPLHFDTLYAAGRGGLFRTMDGGGTWEKLPIDALSPYTPTTISSVFVDPIDPNLVYASLENVGVARSIDGGTSWLMSGLQGGQTILAFAADPNHPGLVYAGGTGMFKSLNNGQTWSTVGLTALTVAALLVDPDRPGRLYAGTSVPSTMDHGSVYMTENEGANWTVFGSGLPERCSVKGLAFGPGPDRTLHAAVGGNGYYGTAGWEFLLSPVP